MNPDMPWNEEIRAATARWERGVASPGTVALEVLVSSTLRDLVIGSGLEFEDHGTHQLKGVPGEWHLFAVAS